jgi:hypothetical protein
VSCLSKGREEIADELFKAKDSIELLQQAMRQLYMTQQAKTTTTSKKKTIKYSASSWKHKGMRLLRL